MKMTQVYGWLNSKDNIKEHKDTWTMVASQYHFLCMLMNNRGNKFKQINQLAKENNIIIPNDFYKEIINIRL